jgi:uncharacterized protein (TIGR02996 family)
MTQDEAFLQAIIESPEDDAPRLVYADYLEEHGQAARAEFIRLQCELAKRPQGDGSNEALAIRGEEIFTEYGNEWLRPLQDLGEDLYFEFHRGFVWGLSAEASRFLDVAEEVLRITPLRHVELFVERGVITRLAESSWLQRLTSLRLRWDEIGPANVRILVASPYLVNLTALDLYDRIIRGGGLKAIAKSPHLGKLRELVLGWNNISWLGVRALAESPLLVHLTYLDLSFNAFGDRGVVALASSPSAAGLSYLGLVGSGVENAGGRALAESPYLISLTSLDLHYSRTSEEVKDLLRARFGNRVHF